LINKLKVLCQALFLIFFQKNRFLQKNIARRQADGILNGVELVKSRLVEEFEELILIFIHEMGRIQSSSRSAVSARLDRLGTSPAG
jgi:hypothetical protein